MVNRHIRIVFAVSLDISEAFFYRHQVWRVRGQEKDLASGIVDDLPCGGGFVEGGVVDDEDCILRQLRQELLTQPCIERVGVARAIEQAGRRQFLANQSCDQAGAGALVAGTEPGHTPPAQSIAVVPLCRALKSGFIDVNKRAPRLRQGGVLREIIPADVFIVERFFIPPRFFYGSVSSGASRKEWRRERH